MKIEINDYYTNIITDIIIWLQNCTPGKRKWCDTDIPGWNYDYRSTERSTFPDWLSFWYKKPPRNNIYKYNHNYVAYENGYFNGNTRELLSILKRAKTSGMISKKSKRIQIAFDIIIDGYFTEMKEMEYL